MPEINVPAIIEAAAAADCDRSYPYAMAHAAMVLPGIAEALYAPILALHTVRLVTERLPNGVALPNWKACSCGVPTHSACPTVRIIEANLAAIRGQAHA